MVVEMQGSAPFILVPKKNVPLLWAQPLHFKLSKNRVNMNETWQFEGRRVKSQKLKSLKHMVVYG
jgi:hypothetical protein